MKILFIFTGGTIGSTQTGNIICTDTGKPNKIISAYANKHGIPFEYDIVEPYTELSENNTGATIKMLVECVKNNLYRGYDGIIVTHGTDSLQYSASAIGYCIGLDTVPVCIVSANVPVENEKSNALDNLHGAIRFIEMSAGRGAFVIYRNSNSDTVQIHRATRLIGAKAYSDEIFSLLGSEYGCFDKDCIFVKNPSYREEEDAISPLDVSVIKETNSSAMLLYSYPGMKYPEIEENVKYIILNSFHSGTVNTKSKEAISFFESAKSKSIPVYVTGVSDGPQYSGSDRFNELGITPIKNISPISAYIKLWLICEAGLSLDDNMDASLSGDKV
ncbi:MAG: asparaginase [Clostridia bacterium]|nr:asparaginase [Clostridia bacterium]